MSLSIGGTMPDEKKPTFIFDWCKECVCLKDCYYQHGELSSTPLCLDPECSEGPAR